ASIAAIRQAESAYKRDGSLTGTTTGLTDLDKILAGLQPSDLLVLAGRPSMGKTQLAVAIARNAAQKHHATDGKEGAVVGFFSLEMSGEQLASRIHADVTSIESDRMRKGEIGIDEFEYLERTAQDQLYDLPLYIDATSELTLSAIRTRARRLKRQRNLGLIIVDYLQLISAPKGRRAESRVQEVSEMTRGLKILAKELNVPVVV
ncbi:MAG: DnaB-like helicase C-terminal domain-containing protein, partial [Magnetospiraceae bacterium]